MKKKLIILAVLVAALYMVSGCSNSPTDGPVPSNTSGVYKSKDFRAEVDGNKIDIYIMDLDEGFETLYWRGTWKQGEHVVVSIADRESLDASIMGSGADNKEFTVDDDSLGFEFQAMGSTQDISLDKD